MKNGSFIISLDFELNWGVFDAIPLEEYRNNLQNVTKVIPRLMELADVYNIRLTFATVGLLFAKSKKEMLSLKPTLEASYLNGTLNPYRLLDNIEESEEDDKLHYASELIHSIVENKNHELSSHTFGHYNCLAEGQTLAEFEADVVSSQNAARLYNLNLTSIVFPKNEVNSQYLDICSKHGFITYRGTENSFIYNQSSSLYRVTPTPVIRLFRMLDTYINLTGHNTYAVPSNDSSKILDLPSSRFLRPYSRRLKRFEGLKIKRILNGMSHAAVKNETFHLWWHPHNFGDCIQQNFSNLEVIFREYAKLKTKHNFSSETMTSVALMNHKK
tara:strand:+ start:1223 stop:2209 length:987 start_codon:yes stop_codon:yes gene_type:complete